MSTVSAILALLLIVGANCRFNDYEDDYSPQRRQPMRGRNEDFEEDFRRLPFPIRRYPNGLPMDGYGRRGGRHSSRGYEGMPHRRRGGMRDRRRHHFDEDFDEEEMSHRRGRGGKGGREGVRRRGGNIKFFNSLGNRYALNYAKEGYTYAPPQRDLNEEYDISFTTGAPAKAVTLEFERPDYVPPKEEGGNGGKKHIRNYSSVGNDDEPKKKKKKKKKTSKKNREYNEKNAFAADDPDESTSIWGGGSIFLRRK